MKWTLVPCIPLCIGLQMKIQMFHKAYFIDPELICGEGRTLENFEKSGTGNRLIFLNGTTNFEVPLDLDEIEGKNVSYSQESI